MSLYCFVPLAELTECMVSHCGGQSLLSIRKNVAQTECCVEYEGEKHSCLDSYESKTKAEAVAHMSGESYGRRLRS